MDRSIIVTMFVCLFATGLAAMQGPPAGPSGAARTPPSRPSSPAPAAPPRDTSAPAHVAGAAVIYGRVTMADAGTPLRGAIVTAWPRGASGGRAIVSARVGDDGRYRIEGVAPGEYGLVARHPAFVSQALGQTTPRTPERSLLVTAGAVAGPLDFAMLRGAALFGRIVDESGEPVERISVRASKLRRFASRWELLPHGEAVVTNDLGEYRLHGLPPGEYVVGADPPRHSRATDQVVSPDTRDLVPTWAPGTPSPADAHRVRLEAGGEGQADIQLAEAAVASIAGRAVDSRGQVIADAIVGLYARGGRLDLRTGNTAVNGDGSFRFDGVPPGTYTIGVVPRRSGAFDPRAGQPATEIGYLDVEVAAGTTTPVTVRTEPGTTIKGRLIVDGDAAPLVGRAPFVVAAAVDEVLPVPLPSARARVNPDFSFELQGARGRVQLRLTGMPEGWWTRSVRRGGADLTDRFDVGDAAAIDGVEVIISTKPTGVRGTVKRPTGADVDAVVLLFAQDERRWEESMSAAGTTIVRPVEDGSFRTPTMRPGAYFAIALGTTDVRSDDLGDPDYLRELAPRATRIDVTEGQIPELALIVP
jgi:hypothetical protein